MLKKAQVLAAPVAFVFLTAATPAGILGAQSFETDLALGDCSIAASNDFETTWACPGYKGIPVEVTTARNHFMVSYGLTSTTEPAASQTLPPENTLGPTIEWRLANSAGRWTPFATILRFLSDAGGKHAEVLVVTRLGEGTTCHIAYVDALANPDAASLAEQAADAHARDFNCKRDKPVIIGKFAAW